ncbi:uncharacterized protein LOC126809887 [Patella vulgata]|uniref:uncharacterized protein LOC126809887 n=1 Tax=Patella vulgata TaxID=6465 RepID=UPI00218088E5|nr:uncharacterized protein LOC126809887 [Patella vulgata]
MPPKLKCTSDCIHKKSNTGLSKQKSIEDYVSEIVLKIEFEDLIEIEDIFEKLNKMKFHTEKKHRLNYSKVIQCLGEVGIEEILYVIRLSFLEYCDDHMYSQLNIYMGVLVAVMISAGVIKRVLYRRDSIIPHLFKCLQQTYTTSLVSKTYETLLRLLLVGTKLLVDLYLKLGILTIMNKHLEHAATVTYCGIDEVEALYMAKILRLMVEYGNRQARCAVKKSRVLMILKKDDDYIDDDMIVEELMEIDEYIKGKARNHFNRFIEDSARIRLYNEMPDNNFFCSSPHCRKLVKHGQYRYCGNCKLTRYCDRACQKYHWSVGHKHRCLKLSNIIDV